MLFYLVYDTWVTMNDEVHAATIEMLTSEMGTTGSKYTCCKSLTPGVPIHSTVKFREQKQASSRKVKRKKHTKVIGYVRYGDVVESLDQRFYKGTPRIKIRFLASGSEGDATERQEQPDTAGGVGEVAATPTEPEPEPMPGTVAADGGAQPMDAESGRVWLEGWVSFCAAGGGFTADRFFMLQAHDSEEKSRKSAGKVKLNLRKEGEHVTVTVLRCKNLKKLDFLGANDDYCVVTINGEEEEVEKWARSDQSRRTSTLPEAGANPVWNNGLGEKLEFEGIKYLHKVHVQCFDEDTGGVETDDLIGECTLPLDEIIDIKREREGKAWQWEGWRVVREPDGEPSSLLPTGNPLHLIKAIESKGKNLVHVADTLITDELGQLAHAVGVRGSSSSSNDITVDGEVNQDIFDNPLATNLSSSVDMATAEEEVTTFDIESDAATEKHHHTKSRFSNPFKSKHKHDASALAEQAAMEEFNPVSWTQEQSTNGSSSASGPKKNAFKLGDTSDSV
jgi:hypothetical protein